MAILAAIDIASADTDTLIYTVPANRVATVQVSMCNRNVATAELSLALTSGSAPGAANWVEWRHPIDGFCPLERAPQRLAAGERIYARSSITGVSVVVTGEADTPIGV